MKTGIIAAILVGTYSERPIHTSFLALRARKNDSILTGDELATGRRSITAPTVMLTRRNGDRYLEPGARHSWDYGPGLAAHGERVPSGIPSHFRRFSEFQPTVTIATAEQVTAIGIAEGRFSAKVRMNTAMMVTSTAVTSFTRLCMFCKYLYHDGIGVPIVILMPAKPPHDQLASRPASYGDVATGRS
jgi:hypothetical protein